jgi:lipoprotein-anchoring transpeptidase ErfK/SrfK
MGNDKIINEDSQPESVKATNDEGISNGEGIIKVTDSLWKKLGEKEKLISTLRNILTVFIPFLAVLFIFIFMLYLVPVLKEMTSGQKTEITTNQELKKTPAFKKKISLITKDIQRLSKKYNSYTSGQSYIVINTTDNRFFLYRNKKLIREGYCSTGSLTLLKTEKGDREWVFKTPKGKHWIQGKTTNPSWKRPDWSFVEEGSPVPPKDDPSRYEYGVLGDYAMSIGEGYLIHGTIYKRFLGMPVTHGCVRLNDEDLEVIFNTLSIGSKVYIF